MLSIQNIVYYPQIDLVSYRIGNIGNGVTTRSLFYKIYRISVSSQPTMIFNTNAHAHAYAVRNLQ